MQISAVCKNENIAFGARLTPEMKKAERALCEFIRKGYSGSTYMRTFTYPEGYNYKNQRQMIFIKLKQFELSCKIKLHRAFWDVMKSSNRSEENELVMQLVKSTRVVNCGEGACILQKMLEKEGLKSKIYTDADTNHSFVLIGDMSKFNHYKTRGTDIFIVDPWQKKIYNSVNEAYTDFCRLFNKPREDKTVRYKSYIYERLEVNRPKEKLQENKAYNKSKRLKFKNALKQLQKIFEGYKKQFIKEEDAYIPPHNEKEFTEKLDDLALDIKDYFYERYGIILESNSY